MSKKQKSLAEVLIQQDTMLKAFSGPHLQLLPDLGSVTATFSSQYLQSLASLESVTRTFSSQYLQPFPKLDTFTESLAVGYSLADTYRSLDDVLKPLRVAERIWADFLEKNPEVALYLKIQADIEKLPPELKQALIEDLSEKKSTIGQRAEGRKRGPKETPIEDQRKIVEEWERRQGRELQKNFARRKGISDRHLRRWVKEHGSDK